MGWKDETAASLLCSAGISLDLLPQAESAVMITPDGQAISLVPPFPSLTFGDTDLSGFYRLMQQTREGPVESYIAINAFWPEESDLQTQYNNPDAPRVIVYLL